MEIEIEFRAKTKNGNKWIYGDLLHPTNTLNNKYAIFEIGGGAIIVVPKTIGQYTGLCDKNGKKIYEGDIVKDGFGNVGKIWFSKHFLRWQVSFYKGKEDLCKYPEIGCNIFDWIYPYMDLEVIGNVYDNKDLLD